MFAFRAILCLLAFSSCALAQVGPAPAPAKPKGGEKHGAASVPIEITADGDTRFVAGIATANENVVVRHGTDLLYADHVSYDVSQHIASADGNVRIYSGSKVYRGDHIVFNFLTKEITSTNFSAAEFPVFAKGESVTTPEPDHYHLTNGYLTTDNRAHPSFRLRAHTMEIYPDDRVVLKDVVLYVENVPVFWVPIYSQSLKSQESTFRVQGGSSSRFGDEVMATFNWRVSDNLTMIFHEDYRSKRGDGGGLDMRYKPVKDGYGLFSGYYLHDKEYYENPTALPRSPMGPDRYRFTLQQFTPLGEGLEAKINANVWSDPYITEDFFQREYSRQRMPDNTLEVINRGGDYEISVLGRAQINRFFDTTERAPEFRIETKPIKVFNTGLEYESETSMVHFQQSYSNQLYNFGTIPKAYSADRWDTYHELLYPKQYFGWLNVTPHVGLRGTAWSHDNLDIASTTADETGKSVERGVIDGGVDLSFKVSRTWTDLKSPTLGIDGIRHVVEPFVHAQAVLPSVGSDAVRGFDDRVANTWANPIGFPFYNSIDSINRQMVARTGVRNQIQTKRDGQNVTLVDWSVFSDLNATSHYDEQNVLTDDTFSHVYSDFVLQPTNWLTFQSRDAIDTGSASYNMHDNSLSWQPNRAYKFTLGDRLLEGLNMVDTYGLPIPNSNQVYFRFFYRLNEHWQFETRHSFNTDDSNLQEQSYTVFRDMSAWQMGVTYSEINNHESTSQSVFYVTLTLKAFPSATARAVQ